MTKPYKLILFTIIVSLATISIIVFRYERLLKEQKKSFNLGSVKGGAPSARKYTAPEIIGLIKASKEYLGDSLTIFDNGDMLSSNDKFQGTIKAVIDSRDNMNMVRANTESNKLPLQYNIYILAATYYRQQYPDEFKAKP